MLSPKEMIETAIQTHLANGGLLQAGTFGIYVKEGIIRESLNGCCALGCLIVNKQQIRKDGIITGLMDVAATILKVDSNWTVSFTRGFDGALQSFCNGNQEAYEFGKEMREKYITHSR